MDIFSIKFGKNLLLLEKKNFAKKNKTMIKIAIINVAIKSKIWAK